MSKKRAPKTTAPVVTPAAEVADDTLGSANEVTNAVDNEASVETGPDATESERRAKGKKSKRKKDKPALAVEEDQQEKREKKAKRRKKDKKEKAEKAEKAPKQDKKAKRDKPKGKKDKSIASELRPLRKVNVRLIEPNGQPRAYFNGEIGVLDLLLPKAEGDDSGT